MATIEIPSSLSRAMPDDRNSRKRVAHALRKNVLVTADEAGRVHSQEKIVPEFDDDAVRSTLFNHKRPREVLDTATAEIKWMQRECMGVPSVLDMGCGSAMMAIHLSKRNGYRGVERCDGIEFSDVMARMAKLNTELFRLRDVISIWDTKGLTEKASVSLQEKIRFYQALLSGNFAKIQRKLEFETSGLSDLLTKEENRILELSATQLDNLEKILRTCSEVLETPKNYHSRSDQLLIEEVISIAKRELTETSNIIYGDAAKVSLSPQSYDRIICNFFTTGNLQDELLDPSSFEQFPLTEDAGKALKKLLETVLKEFPQATTNNEAILSSLINQENLATKQWSDSEQRAVKEVLRTIYCAAKGETPHSVIQDLRDLAQERYTETYLKKTNKFTEFYSNAYKALKPGGKILFSVYRGDDAYGKQTGVIQREFYMGCGLDLVTDTSSKFVMTRQGPLWSRRWTESDILENLAYCGISVTQVRIFPLGTGNIAYGVEVVKKTSQNFKEGGHLSLVCRNGEIIDSSGSLPPKVCQEISRCLLS